MLQRELNRGFLRIADTVVPTGSRTAIRFEFTCAGARARLARQNRAADAHQDGAFARHDHRALQHVTQFTHIAWPGIFRRASITSALTFDHAEVCLRFNIVDQASHSSGKSPSRCRKGGSTILEYVQPVVEILAQFAFSARLLPDWLVEAMMRTSTAISALAAQPPHARILQHAQ